MLRSYFLRSGGLLSFECAPGGGGILLSRFMGGIFPFSSGGLLSRECAPGGGGILLSRLLIGGISGRSPCSNFGGSFFAVGWAAIFGAGLSTFTLMFTPANAAPENPTTPATAKTANALYFIIVFKISSLCYSVCPTCEAVCAAAYEADDVDRVREARSVPDDVARVREARSVPDGAARVREAQSVPDDVAEAAYLHDDGLPQFSSRSTLCLLLLLEGFRKIHFLLQKLLTLLYTSLMSSFCSTSLFQR